MAAINLLRQLSKAGRSYATFIQGFALRGETRTLAKEALERAARIKIDGRTFRRDWNIISNAAKSWDNMKFIKKDSVIRTGFVDSELKRRTEKSVIIRTKVKFLLSGEEGNLFTTIEYNGDKTRRDLEEAAWDAIRQDTDTKVERIGARPVSAFVHR